MPQCQPHLSATESCPCTAATAPLASRRTHVSHPIAGRRHGLHATPPGYKWPLPGDISPFTTLFHSSWSHRNIASLPCPNPPVSATDIAAPVASFRSKDHLATTDLERWWVPHPRTSSHSSLGSSCLSASRVAPCVLGPLQADADRRGAVVDHEHHDSAGELPLPRGAPLSCACPLGFGVLASSLNLIVNVAQC
jgi:hypothetical protein